MKETWYKIKYFDESNADEIRAEILTESDSPWYSGHFPDEPILPGVAQISFVYDLLVKAGNIKMKDSGISGLKRVRFRKLIKPGELLKVEIKKSNKDNLYNFKLFNKEELACSGTLVGHKL